MLAEESSDLICYPTQISSLYCRIKITPSILCEFSSIVRYTVEQPVQVIMAMRIGLITYERLLLERLKWETSGLSSLDRPMFQHALLTIISGNCGYRAVEATGVIMPQR